MELKRTGSQQKKERKLILGEICYIAGLSCSGHYVRQMFAYTICLRESAATWVTNNIIEQYPTRI